MYYSLLMRIALFGVMTSMANAETPFYFAKGISTFDKQSCRSHSRKAEIMTDVVRLRPPFSVIGSPREMKSVC